MMMFQGQALAGGVLAVAGGATAYFAYQTLADGVEGAVKANVFTAGIIASLGTTISLFM